MVKKLLRIFPFLLTLTLVALALVGALRVWVHVRAAGRIYASIRDARPAPVALVLGAGLRRDGLPTPALYDRVATAVDLYKAGKVKKLLMSGDNRFVNYNEPAAMKKLAERLGVPSEDIVLDYAGRRTYDSCYRAREIFGVQQALVVTQRFHLDRALFLCDALGVQATGVVADRREYAPYRWWEMREVLATAAAWWDVNVRRPAPVLGEKLPIQISTRPAGRGRRRPHTTHVLPLDDKAPIEELAQMLGASGEGTVQSAQETLASVAKEKNSR